SRTVIHSLSLHDALPISAIYEPISCFKGEISFEEIKKLIQANDIKEIKDEEIIDNVIKGAVVIFISSSDKILSVDIQKFNTRARSEEHTSELQSRFDILY